MGRHGPRRGLVAAGLHPSPFPHADIVTTTNHKTLRGPRGGMIFSRRELPPGVDPADYPMVKPTLAATIDRACSRRPGRPADAHHRGQGRGLKLAAEEFRATSDGVQRRSWRDPAALGARLMTGGTDNHLILVDVTPLGVTGREAERLLDEIGITVNKNAIPFDTTTEHRLRDPDRDAGHDQPGLRADEMRAIARLIVEAIPRATTPATARLAAEAREIADRFPVPGPARGVRRDRRATVRCAIPVDELHAGCSAPRRSDRRRLRLRRGSSASCSRPASGASRPFGIVDRADPAGQHHPDPPGGGIAVCPRS